MVLHVNNISIKLKKNKTKVNINLIYINVIENFLKIKTSTFIILATCQGTRVTVLTASHISMKENKSADLSCMDSQRQEPTKGPLSASMTWPLHNTLENQ